MGTSTLIFLKSIPISYRSTGFCSRKRRSCIFFPQRTYKGSVRHSNPPLGCLSCCPLLFPSAIHTAPAAPGWDPLSCGATRREICRCGDSQQTPDCTWKPCLGARLVAWPGCCPKPFSLGSAAQLGAEGGRRWPSAAPSCSPAAASTARHIWQCEALQKKPLRFPELEGKTFSEFPFASSSRKIAGGREGDCPCCCAPEDVLLALQIAAHAQSKEQPSAKPITACGERWQAFFYLLVAGNTELLAEVCVLSSACRSPCSSSGHRRPSKKVLLPWDCSGV